MFDLTSAKEVSFVNFNPNQEESENKVLYMLRIKFDILFHSILATTFILGLSSALSRQILKFFERLMNASEKFYKVSYWLTLFGNFYLISVFVHFWEFGSLSEYKIVKGGLIVLNMVVILIVKTVFIESAQTLIIRDMAILNIGLATYVMTYPCSFPYLTVLTWLICYFEFIICRHTLDVENSYTFRESFKAVTEDPENKEEVQRLQISEQARNNN